MNTTEVFLIAMLIILTVPYAVWRLGRTEHFAPLVVVQVLTGIALGPGVLGAVFPDYYKFVFAPPVIQSLNGIAWWAVSLFVFIAGIELDLRAGWGLRRTMLRLPAKDRWYVALIWLVLCAFGADGCGLHFMVGAFLAGVVMDAERFDQDQMDLLRHHVLPVMMPVFFLSTGLRTSWGVGGSTVFLMAGVLLLDKQIITADTFTALLLMAVGSTMPTIPVVTPKLARWRAGAHSRVSPLQLSP